MQRVHRKPILMFSRSGIGMQTPLKHPLSPPFTSGIGHGAAFGALAANLLLGLQIVSVTISAFAGAVCSTVVIMLLACFNRLFSEAIILAGVGTL